MSNPHVILAASCTTAALIGALAYHVVHRRRSAAERWRLARDVAIAAIRLGKVDDEDVDSDYEAEALAVARNLAAEAAIPAPTVYRSVGSVLSLFSFSSSSSNAVRVPSLKRSLRARGSVEPGHDCFRIAVLSWNTNWVELTPRDAQAWVDALGSARHSVYVLGRRT